MAYRFFATEMPDTGVCEGFSKRRGLCGLA